MIARTDILAYRETLYRNADGSVNQKSRNFYEVLTKMGWHEVDDSQEREAWRAAHSSLHVDGPNGCC